MNELHVAYKNIETQEVFVNFRQTSTTPIPNIGDVLDITGKVWRVIERYWMYSKTYDYNQTPADPHHYPREIVLFVEPVNTSPANPDTPHT